MAQTQTPSVPQAAAPVAGPGAAGRQPLLLAALGVWILIGLIALWVIVFGGYDGRPVDDPGSVSLTQHHGVFGPFLLVWLALSALGVPRVLQALARKPD